MTATLTKKLKKLFVYGNIEIDPEKFSKFVLYFLPALAVGISLIISVLLHFSFVITGLNLDYLYPERHCLKHLKRCTRM